MGSLSLHQKIGLFLVLLFHAYLLVPVEAASGMNKWEATNFCKCICYGTNFTILRLDLPDNPSQPCMSCTKQWCLNQNLPICAGAKVGDTNPDTATGKEGDVEARCFQRNSPRDQLVVTLFLLTIFGLLLAAGLKNRMIKAGFTPVLPWNTRRRWWEEWDSWLPSRRQREQFGLERFGRSPEREVFIEQR